MCMNFKILKTVRSIELHESLQIRESGNNFNQKHKIHTRCLGRKSQILAQKQRIFRCAPPTSTDDKKKKHPQQPPGSTHLKPNKPPKPSQPHRPPKKRHPREGPNETSLVKSQFHQSSRCAQGTSRQQQRNKATKTCVPKDIQPHLI